MAISGPVMVTSIGNCFGVDYKPYGVSAKTCVAYLPVLHQHKTNREKRFNDLNSGRIKALSSKKYNYRTRQDEVTVVKKGDREFASLLKGQIHDAERQIKYINEDITEMQGRIDNWKPGTLRRVEGLPGVS